MSRLYSQPIKITNQPMISIIKRQSHRWRYISLSIQSLSILDSLRIRMLISSRLIIKRRSWSMMTIMKTSLEFPKLMNPCLRTILIKLRGSSLRTYLSTKTINGRYLGHLIRSSLLEAFLTTSKADSGCLKITEFTTMMRFKEKLFMAS
jgi:hypothetical protein